MTDTGTSTSTSRLGLSTLTIILIAIPIILYVLAAIVFHALGEEGSWYLLALFFIPLIQLFIPLKLDRTPLGVYFLGIKLACLLPLFVLWGFYSSQYGVRYQHWFALGLTILLVMGLIRFTFTLMVPSRESWEWLKDLATEMQKHIFMALIFFLSIFLCITYLLGFSLAFHDIKLRSKSEEQSLFASDYKDRMKPRHVNQTAIDAKFERPPDDGNIPKILFGSGTSEIQVDEDDYGRDPTICNDLRSELHEEVYRKIANKVALESIREKLIEESKESKVWILLKGHSNEDPLDPKRGNYDANYQLSVSRAGEVLSYLVNKLPASLTNSFVVEKWIPTGVGSDPSFFGEVPTEELPCGADGWRSVEVHILPKPGPRFDQQDVGRQLTLLDYMYFTIYTITTTGYGDIIPVSDFAKFITSMANFFELFFLAVFFNGCGSFQTGDSWLRPA